MRVRLHVRALFAPATALTASLDALANSVGFVCHIKGKPSHKVSSAVEIGSLFVAVSANPPSSRPHRLSAMPSTSSVCREALSVPDDPETAR